MKNCVLVWTLSLKIFSEQKLSLCTHLIIIYPVPITASSALRIIESTRRWALPWTSRQFLLDNIYIYFYMIDLSSFSKSH